MSLSSRVTFLIPTGLTAIAASVAVTDAPPFRSVLLYSGVAMLIAGGVGSIAWLITYPARRESGREARRIEVDRLNVRRQALEAEITERDAEISRLEYHLGVATEYADALRMEDLRAQIMAQRAPRESAQVDLSLVNREIAVLDKRRKSGGPA